jgi:sulfane dehydrogenase subunit SoxC
MGPIDMSSLKTIEKQTSADQEDKTPNISSPRRLFFKKGLDAAGLVALAGTSTLSQAQSSVQKDFPNWSTVPGKGLNEYGTPSPHEASTKRGIAKAYGELSQGTGSTRTPLEKLEGIITPSGLHFERSHNGVPDINPKEFALTVHGLVKEALNFSIENLLRYPMKTRTYFIECAGNSAQNILAPQPIQGTAGSLHGLISCSDWTGIPLSVLLEESGLDPKGRWVLAEGADAASMSRSIPIEKCLDDAMIALYQNGERLRPEQGYPARLLLPGWEGNMNVKWLRSLKVTSSPTHTKDETSKYTDPMSNGLARQFTFEMGVKSIITNPSGTMKLPRPGLVQISGIAWSGAGRIARVELSSDGGNTWFDASLEGANTPHSLVRFRAPWNWKGERALLQSRAIDEKGQIQPTRKAYKANNAVDGRYHNNTIVTWAVETDGSVKNVYL